MATAQGWRSKLRRLQRENKENCATGQMWQLWAEQGKCPQGHGVPILQKRSDCEAFQTQGRPPRKMQLSICHSWAPWQTIILINSNKCFASQGQLPFGKVWKKLGAHICSHLWPPLIKARQNICNFCSWPWISASRLLGARAPCSASRRVCPGGFPKMRNSWQHFGFSIMDQLELCSLVERQTSNQRSFWGSLAPTIVKLGRPIVDIRKSQMCNLVDSWRSRILFKHFVFATLGQTLPTWQVNQIAERRWAAICVCQPWSSSPW